MTNDEVQELKEKYNSLKKEYKQTKQIFMDLEKKGTKNMYLLKKEELVTLLKYWELKNRYLEQEMTVFLDNYISKSELKDRLKKITDIKKEFKENLKNTKNKKISDYWEQQIIALIEQEKILNYYIN